MVQLRGTIVICILGIFSIFHLDYLLRVSSEVHRKQEQRPVNDQFHLDYLPGASSPTELARILLIRSEFIKPDGLSSRSSS
jgi:hypothetical protein